VIHDLRVQRSESQMETPTHESIFGSPFDLTMQEYIFSGVFYLKNGRFRMMQTTIL
jgi:hypothetical protein